MRRTYDFDQVALVPQFNNVPSRTVPDLESWLTRHRRVKIPLLAANMDTVIGSELAELLIENGTYPIYHRFTEWHEQKRWVSRFRDKTFISCGVHDIDRVRELLDLGAVGACIDVAHGHSDRMMDYIGELKRSHPDKDVIAGNVCTAMAYHDLVNAGADAIKVGIGSGSPCTTRAVTAFGTPQFSAIQDCAAVAEKLRVPLIADGGIRGSRDLVLALAAGASTIMIGRLFALTEESAAPKRPAASADGGLEAKYRGQASEDFQSDFYGGLKEYTVAEGVHFWAPVSGAAQTLIDTLLGGLRSGLTYGGAKSIKELQRKAEFVEIVPG
ncbi:MAG: guanosine monophosphate reductase [Gammaproteobacteria bacterium]|nr:guanosine monophosphate reductase [Gammaproteobacteria bacterium]NIR83477.1 guanosine monophosphate reductase [Gammaproteobacteria bacterium]NIR91399.1 guanosine monophosphate reductase [Gammaproteobacteria bacterium]NIU04639.1 guanosine monophosphate reductase [Gammaproteobacteria bacterium]NIV51681.1 guanosine monophosphate reductase [Gammaproteobacteria bacterium]